MKWYVIELMLPETGYWYRLDCEYSEERAQQVLESLRERHPTTTYRMRWELDKPPLQEHNHKFGKHFLSFLKIMFIRN